MVEEQTGPHVSFAGHCGSCISRLLSVATPKPQTREAERSERIRISRQLVLLANTEFGSVKGSSPKVDSEVEAKVRGVDFFWAGADGKG